MKIRKLSLADCSRILKQPRCGLTAAATLHRWPGSPAVTGKRRWEVPHEFLEHQFGVSRETVIAALVENGKVH